MTMLTEAQQLNFIAEAWGLRVAQIAGKIFRHPNRASVPPDLLKDLSEVLAASADDEVQYHADYLRFQAALHVQHREALKRIPCRPERPSAKPIGEAVTLPPDDTYAHTGTIGAVSLGEGCYSFYETWNLAIPNIVQRGLRDYVLAKLASGVTVRQLLRRMYGVVSEAAPSPGVSHSDEMRSFRRLLKRAR
jgi:hypothetical protein